MLQCGQGCRSEIRTEPGAVRGSLYLKVFHPLRILVSKCYEIKALSWAVVSVFQLGRSRPAAGGKLCGSWWKWLVEGDVCFPPVDSRGLLGSWPAGLNCVSWALLSVMGSHWRVAGRVTWHVSRVSLGPFWAGGNRVLSTCQLRTHRQTVLGFPLELS